MLVFIDTTETRQNPSLDGVKWEKLGQFALQSSSSVILTDLVIEETTNHVREDLGTLREQLAKCTAMARRVGSQALRSRVPQPDVDAELLQYQARLSARIESLHLRNASYHDVPIRDLISRALQRRQPSDKNGHAGFRDAVQWEIILATALKTTEPILFVTSNTRDFGAHAVLADDLKNDLIAIGRPDAVTVCQGLDRFLADHVDPTLERLDEIARAIGEGEFKSFVTTDFVLSLYPTIRSEIERAVRHRGLEELDIFSRQFFSEPVLSDLEEDFSIAGVDVFRLNDDELAISITVEFRGRISCQLKIVHGPGIPDWEEFIGDATFAVSLGALVSEKTGEDTESTIDEITVGLGHEWPFDDMD